MKIWRYSMLNRGGLLLLGWATFFLFCPAAEASVVLARVGEEIITVIELQEALRTGATDRKKAMEQLVEDRLLYLEAQRQRLEVESLEITAAYQKVKNRFPSQQVFYQSLKQQGISPGVLKDNIRRQLLREKIIDREVRNRIDISPVELSRYLEKHRARLLSSGLVFDLLYTVFNQPDEIPEDPADFPEEQTVATGKAVFSTLSETVQEAVAELAPGEHSSPVRIGDSWIVFTVLSVEGKDRLDERELILAARWELYQEQFDRAYRQLITRLNRETDIRYYFTE